MDTLQQLTLLKARRKPRYFSTILLAKEPIANTFMEATGIYLCILFIYYFYLVILSVTRYSLETMGVCLALQCPQKTNITSGKWNTANVFRNIGQNIIQTVVRTRGHRHGSTAACMLGLRVRISPVAWMSVVSVVCCQVEVSASW